jgi:hypothetical protein
MASSSRTLTPTECDEILKNLDECLAVFEKKTGMLNSTEIRAKSMLTVVRREIARSREQSGLTELPFS